MGQSLPSGQVHERRQQPRFRVGVRGRVWNDEGAPARCLIVDLSITGACVEATTVPLVGARIELDVPTVGRLRGRVVRSDPFDFGAVFEADILLQQKLVERLARFAAAEADADGEERRFVPRERGYGPALVTLSGKPAKALPILDRSHTGAAFVTAERPAIGSVAMVNAHPARVVRHFRHGFAVVFEYDLDAKQVSADRA
ncbi:PilZ domain-containing protein [Maricaulis sp.]|uniref:PilZ domain-containing protein n=1 Tax=Maricaulis sp. TaxID=1486257 RepID=UPI002B2713D7|nr:PilZ domain-containing protein [Maricaulis sp.]